MNTDERKNIRTDKLNYLVYAIITVGILLRICIYFQNRNLFLDEANVARNIYERNFAQLTQPLSYYQYAPPLFLWALKFLTNCFGYGEKCFRSLSLLSGIGSLLITYFILLKFQIKKVMWYPLGLMAAGPIYLRYATELKQYSWDTFIGLAMIYIVLSLDFKKIGHFTFISLWALVGSFAIWGSMPSVFILAGIGAYYFLVFYFSKDYKRIFTMIPVVLFWLIQFSFYYSIVLKPQIQSDYLQNCHRDNFLFLVPHNWTEFGHNWDKTSNILGVATGHWVLSVVFHILLISVALVYSVRQKLFAIVLLVLPIVLILFAASIHQFTLDPRVVLLVMPLILILIAIGFERSSLSKAVYSVFIIISLICIYNFNRLDFFYKPLEVENITNSMRFVQQEHIPATQLYIHAAAYPAYIYYTTIHPHHLFWTDKKNAHRLDYSQNYDSLATTMVGQTALLYSYEAPNQVKDQQSAINRHIKTVKHYNTFGSQVFVYESGF